MDLPPIKPDWSLFLDLDGTLIDIAPAPDRVVVVSDLVDGLDRVRKKLGGALAIVSGRSLAEIDRLLDPVRFACGAEHGAVIRFSNGVIEQAGADQRPPAAWLRTLRRETKDWRGVIVEEKSHAIAVHYRLAPSYEDRVKGLLTSLVNGASSDFIVATAKKAFEIRPKGITKGLVVEELMKSAPFRGRMPVFVGDDVTDEDGMRMARALGGIGLHVASDFGGETAQVRAWIRRAAEVAE